MAENIIVQYEPGIDSRLNGVEEIRIKDEDGKEYSFYPREYYGGFPIIYGGDVEYIERTAIKYENDDVTIIGSGAFLEYRSLQEVNFKNARIIEHDAFQRCMSLPTVNFPNVSYIAPYAFYECESLSEVNIPNVEFIGSYAFFRCRMLSFIYLPKVSYISDNAFGACKTLSEIFLLSSSRVRLSGNVFSGTQIASGTGSIYVPASLLSNYKEAWVSYSSCLVGI